MSRLWSAWLRRCAAEEDARPLAMVRIGVALAILLDLLRVAWLGLVPVIFVPFSAGGLSAVQDQAWVLGRFLPLELGGPLAFWVTVLCCLFIATGVGLRPAVLIGVLAYAQLGHLYPPGDRAIDRILRTVLLVLAFSGAEGRWSLSRIRRDTVPVWAGDLIKTQLVVVYLSAGLSKLIEQPRWLATEGMPVLYRVLTDPLAAHIDPVAAQGWTGLLRFLGWGTIALECSAFLLYTRLGPVWALFGLTMHLGIAATMELGMFSWGMLAVYPLLFAPWIVRRLDRAKRAA